MTSVVSLYRYPIKGLSAEMVSSLPMTRAHGVAHDREFALALGTTTFDPSNPEPLEKGHSLKLRANEQLAGLGVNLDCATGSVRIKAPDGSIIVENIATAEGVDGSTLLSDPKVKAAYLWCGLASSEPTTVPGSGLWGRRRFSPSRRRPP